MKFETISSKIGIIPPQKTLGILTIALILERLATLFWYNLRFSDSDQTILWAMTKDLIEGKYYGLCFYGQSYNSALEAFLAVPLIALGLSYPLSFGIITNALAILPFLLLSKILMKRQGMEAAIIPLIIALLLPPEYLMLTSISRGFVTGIAVMSIGLYLATQQNRAIPLLFAGIMIPLAIFANPNSLLLTPLYLLCIGKEEKRSYIYLFLGLTVGSIIFLYNNYFYNLYPERAFHPAPALRFSLEAFYFILQNLENYFPFLTPVVWKVGWILLPIYIYLPFRLIYKGDWFKGTILGLCVVGLFLSFFLVKTTDATNSVYFSGSRMYLSLPLLLSWMLTENFSTFLTYERIQKLFWVGIFALAFKVMALPLFIKGAHIGSKNAIVHVFKHKEMEQHCQLIKRMAKMRNIQAVVGNSSQSGNQHLAYGCACLLPEFPLIVLNDYERRPWLREKAKGIPVKIIYDCDVKRGLGSGKAGIVLPGSYPPFIFGLEKR